MKEFDPSEHLSPDDLEKILRLTDEIHRNLGFGEIQNGFLAALRDVIEFDAAWASILNKKTGGLTIALVDGPVKWTETYEDCKMEDPLFRYFFVERKYGVVRMTDLIAPEELWRTRFFQDVMRPVNVAWSMVLGADLLPDVACGFSLRRFLGRPDFSYRDKAVLVALHPHVETALRNALTYAQLDRTAALLEEVFRSEDRGLVVAEPGGTIRLINLKAAGVLAPLPHAEGSGPGLSLLRLPLEMDALIASVDDRPVERCVRLHNGRPLSVRIEPQETAVGERLFMIEIEKDADAAGRDVLRIKGLSCRELEVAELAALGRSNKEIGKALFISEETVKVHMRRIFAKLGIRSRTALIARWHGAGKQIRARRRSPFLPGLRGGRAILRQRKDSGIGRLFAGLP